MTRQTVVGSALAGTAAGTVAATAVGPTGWVIGGAGALAGLAFAVVFVFGFGIGVRLALAAGESTMLVWRLNPFFSVAIVYGTGCGVVASVGGALAYAARERAGGH